MLKCPQYSNSIAVVFNIKWLLQLKQSYKHLRKLFPFQKFLLGEFIPGNYYRALVIDGKLLNIGSGKPHKYKGDGINSIAKLLKDEIVVNALPILEYHCKLPRYSTI